MTTCSVRVVLAPRPRVSGGECVTNDLHARLRVGTRCQMCGSISPMRVLAQNGLRQRVHLAAMLRSTRTRAVATAGTSCRDCGRGTATTGAVQLVLDGACEGSRGHEPAVAGARRNIGVTCRKRTLTSAAGTFCSFAQAVHQLLRIAADRAVQGAARRDAQTPGP